MSVDEYCRELEAYLCRKNDGHLIRIAGPAFDRVSGWARQGIPIAVACAGVDRYFERYYRRGPRRRPVRIEFCEADVLDAFDAWRRAIGVPREDEAAPPRRPALSRHLERAIAQLTGLRASAQATRAIDDTLDRVIRALDALQGPAKAARGAARDALLDELATLDAELTTAALATLNTAAAASLRADAEAQVAPFRERMTTDAFEKACRAAMWRQVRERFGLPTLAFE